MSRITGSSSTTNTFCGRICGLGVLRLRFRLCVILFSHSSRLSAHQIEAKDRSSAGNADLKPEATAHSLDKATADKQSQASSAHRRCQGARRAHELLEDL